MQTNLPNYQIRFHTCNCKQKVTENKTKRWRGKGLDCAKALESIHVRGNVLAHFDIKDSNWSHYKLSNPVVLCLIPLMNRYVITPIRQFSITYITLKISSFYSFEDQCSILHVYANTLCTCCLGNKLPYHVLQLPPQFGQSIHLPNEMGWKLWIMAIFQTKRNKPLIATWPLSNFNRERRKALQHWGNHLLLPLLYFGFK